MRASDLPFAVTFLLTLCVLAPAGALAADIPYDLAVRVEFGEELGSERVREQIEKTVVNELQRAACYESVHRYDPDAEPAPELILVARIEEVVERVEHDVSMAEEFEAIRENPRAQLKVTGILEATVYFTLVDQRSALELKTVQQNLRVQRRPQFLGEDYLQTLRDDAVEVLAERAQKLACKGSVKKLEKMIEKARARAADSR
jgi:hypothetical protein